MNNFSNLLNFGFEFLKKYYSEYFRLLLKPFACALLGVLIMILIQQNPNIALLGLLSIPLFCYAFWKGYLATFALNYATISFKNSQNEPLEELVLKINEKELAKFLGFSAIITIIGYLPSIIYAFKTVDIMALVANPMTLLSNISALVSVFLALLLNSLILIPFFNFFNQAFFFKKENESFMSLFLNCYKKLDKDGWALSIFFGFIGGVISVLHPLIYLVFALLLNLITFSANSLWFYERMGKESNIN